MRPYPRRAITSDFSTKAACATTTSSIRTPAIPPARCAAPPSSARMPRAPMACPKPRSYWARRRPWKSTTASTTSMPSSSNWMGRWCTPRACRGRSSPPPRSNSPKRSRDLSKCDDFRFLAGVEIIGHQLDGNRPQLRGHRVPDLDHGFLAVDEIQYFVGVDGRAVLYIEKPARIRMQQLDLAHALRTQPINQHIVILIDQRPELGDARRYARA